jgi:hypothetical protein
MWLQRGILHRCVNVQSGHGAKGHQMTDGAIFAFGPYEAKFSFSTYRDEFHTAVYSRLLRLMERLAELETYGETQEGAALLIHREDILRFFFGGNTRGEDKTLLKLKVCLSCLFNPPEHPLSCGHVLCTACARGYGRSKGKYTIQILECPLDNVSMKPCQPRLVQLKPDSAGVRVLALDDGGVRSFLQLKILRLIENEFNGKLSIQHLFDLVIGKGTGSIIALHLANDRWTSGSCSIHLDQVLRASFDRTQIKTLPTISRTNGFFPKYKYHSKGLQTALKTAFTDSRTLFDTPDGKGAALKAAAVAGSAGRPIIFTNYRHSTPSKLPYNVHWPDDPANELKAWEVARASMSNPSYFKPYRRPNSQQIFYETDVHQQSLFLIAGGEHKRIFPNQPSAYPDILLSLGSGSEPESRDSASQMSSSTKRNKKRSRGDDGSREAWYDFLFSLPTDAPIDKFVRLDSLVVSLPERDDLDSIEALQGLFKSVVDMDEIRKLALRLFANLFYFEPAEHKDETSDEGYVQGIFLSSYCEHYQGTDRIGTIECRLPSDTIVIREVGKWFQTGKFAGAFFVVRWDGLDVQNFRIPASTVEGMIKNQRFHLPPVQVKLAGRPNAIDIVLRFPNRELYSISGFPRLFKDRTHSKFPPPRPYAYHQLKTNTEKAKSEDLEISRRPSWNPPTPQRLALVDLGPLKSPLTSNASYRSLGGRRSSNSTSSTTREVEIPESPAEIGELEAERGSYELEASPRSPKPKLKSNLRIQTDNYKKRVRNADKLAILQALKDSEIEQRVAEREAARRRERARGAEPPRTNETPRAPLPWPLRNSSALVPSPKRVSESSEDEIFGQIITSPTIRYVRY